MQRGDRNMKKIILFGSLMVVVSTVLFVLYSNKKVKSEQSLDKEINESISQSECCFSPPPDGEVGVENNQHEKVRSTKKQYDYSCGYTTTRVRVRAEPSLNSKVLRILDFNTKVEVCKYDSKWLRIRIDDTDAFISKDFVSSKIPENKEFDISYVNTNGFKSFMPYTAITSVGSCQYKMQNEIAYTGTYGIRQVNNRYCVAIGTHFNATVGNYVDLVLENGEVIPCVVSDIKADKDTDSYNIMTNTNGCVSEFIVDINNLDSEAKSTGSISSCKTEWDSKVVTIRLYEYNVLEE